MCDREFLRLPVWVRAHLCLQRPRTWFALEHTLNFTPSSEENIYYHTTASTEETFRLFRCFGGHGWFGMKALPARENKLCITSYPMAQCFAIFCLCCHTACLLAVNKQTKRISEASFAVRATSAQSLERGGHHPQGPVRGADSIGETYVLCSDV